MPKNISDDCQQFINKNISSISQLELLFLFFDFPDQDWTPARASSYLRSNIAQEARNMSYFLTKGFLIQSAPDTYRLNTKATGLQDSIENLKNLYDHSRSRLITYIYEKPGDKLKSFSDAFKIKKDD